MGWAREMLAVNVTSQAGLHYHVNETVYQKLTAYCNHHFDMLQLLSQQLPTLQRSFHPRTRCRPNVSTQAEGLPKYCVVMSLMPAGFQSPR